MEGFDVEGTIDIGTKDLLTLVLILDKFDSFNNDVIDLLQNSNDFSFNKLQKVMKNEKLRGAKKLKEFYVHNLDVIEIINIYSHIFNFIACNYDVAYGKLNEDIDKLYHYLLSHKDKINEIIDLVIKVERLGFNNITFNEDFDFTMKDYKVGSYLFVDETFAYLDNMYVVPTYNENKIEYKTKGSNYEILIKKGYKDSLYGIKISLNDLCMDASRLPEELNRKETVDKIIELRTNVIKQYNLLRESVDLSIGIDELKQKYWYIYDLIQASEDKEFKSKLSRVLSDLEEDIMEIEYLSNGYQKEIAVDNPIINEARIESEKKLALQRKRDILINK